MPTYDFRCNQCGRKVALFYKSYKDYDAASHTCPKCGSTSLTRLISRVAIARPGRNYTSMSSDEMQNVMEGGDPRELGSMMQQFGDEYPELGQEYGEVAERLAKGEDPEHVEKDLEAGLGADDSLAGGMDAPGGDD
jgi:putative FmdB family regulatory protein